MLPFNSLVGIACPLAISGIDTDQLLPARFLKKDRAEGYGSVLLHDLRFSSDGTEIAAFPLNQDQYRNARIVVARRNFGGGSSREGAVYALADYGIRCVIAPSFGDIFSGNCINNGVLPATLDERAVETLLALCLTSPEITVDLDRRTITTAAGVTPFEIADIWRERLLNGWDEIDLTLARSRDIADFAKSDRSKHPWMMPAAVDTDKNEQR